MKTKRQYCTNCRYPQSICLCHAIKAVPSKHHIVILQHPSETEHAKGSARLVDLCMDQCKVVIGETASDFAPLQNQLAQQSQPCYLVYPGDNSAAVESMNNDSEPFTLIFIDGSWKKTYKLLQLNPWLEQLPRLSFVDAQQSQYHIRKASRSDSLSTLESVAYCLDHLDNTDTSPLMSVFKAMIDNQWRFMSDNVKNRYLGR